MDEFADGGEFCANLPGAPRPGRREVLVLSGAAAVTVTTPFDAPRAASKGASPTTGSTSTVPVQFVVNGREVSVEVDPRRSLLDVLRETLDQLKGRLKSAAIVLGAVNDGKVSLIAGVTSDLTARVKAGELVNFVAQQVGGKGGGKPDMAMAGGTDPSKLDAALASVRGWVAERA